MPAAAPPGPATARTSTSATLPSDPADATTFSSRNAAATPMPLPCAPTHAPDAHRPSSTPHMRRHPSEQGAARRPRPPGCCAHPNTYPGAHRSGTGPAAPPPRGMAALRLTRAARSTSHRWRASPAAVTMAPGRPSSHSHA